MTGDYFLEVDGIEGESQDERHRGEIELESWSFGGAQSGAGQEDFSGRTRVGRFNAQPLQFTAKVSKASPKLFLVCTTGQHVKNATLFARKAGANQQDYMVIRLTDVLVASYQQSGASETGIPIDQVSLNYTKIEIEYKEQRPDGTLGSSVTAGFDVKVSSRV